jgi:hypothetical protein
MAVRRLPQRHGVSRIADPASQRHGKRTTEQAAQIAQQRGTQ